MAEVCHDVQIEPHLQPLTGEAFTHATANTEDAARLDVSALGFWGNRYQRAFFDVRVFNPNALTYRKLQLPLAYQRQEREKKRLYEQRVHEVELASTSGGMSKSISVAYKRLASLLAEKKGQPYSLVMAWLRCSHSFSLLRPAITCIRGSRSLYKRSINTDSLVLAGSEGQIPLTQ